MTFPFLAYAGMPYQVFGARVGSAALMSAWSRLPIARAGSSILAIASSTADSPSALAASALTSLARSRIAAFSCEVNPFVVAAGFVGAIAWSSHLNLLLDPRLYEHAY